MRAFLTTAALAIAAAFAAPAFAAPELTADEPGRQGDLVDVSQTVSVTIQNGFARTEVVHVFENRGTADMEATYAFPVPIHASLSELSILSGETELLGEVLPKERARRIYEEERDAGRDAAIGEKEGYRRFTFAVSPVRAGQETTIRFVYYQPLEIDSGVARYVYPLEDGGTDEGESFWKREVTLAGDLVVRAEVKSAYPVTDVRVPGLAGEAKVQKHGEGHWTAEVAKAGAKLERDFVLYYRLAENLPGRVELIPYREPGDGPGTFLLVVTPGIDLPPITGGADYTFVLDVSGSMKGKLGTLVSGVVKAVGEFAPEDRFRVVAFNDTARWIVRDFEPATKEGLARAARALGAIEAGGGTNLYEGLAAGLDGLDADRAQSVILVTDGVTNTGVVDPKAFHDLAKRVDVRVFGFLLGNSANWPLMETICDASGGSWDAVSNADDVLGKLLLAKAKVTHECLHDVRLRVDGVRVFDTTDGALGKVWRGQQVLFFGRYDGPGRAELTLATRQTGEDRVYRASFDFPDVDTANPEIERLWALHRIEAIEAERDLGATPAGEARTAIRDLGVAYQLVTDETSMVVLTEEAFADRGIERLNRDRVAKERDAERVRASRPVSSRRVDESAPMFPGNAPDLGGGSGGNGGGALDPITGVLALALAAGGVAAARRRRKPGGPEGDRR